MACHYILQNEVGAPALCCSSQPDRMGEREGSDWSRVFQGMLFEWLQLTLLLTPALAMPLDQFPPSYLYQPSARTKLPLGQAR